MKPRILLSLALLVALPLFHARAGTGTAITGDVTVDTRSSAPVTIPDTALLEALRIVLDKPTGDITEADMLTLTNLRIDGLGIADLTGLEKADNLRILDIRRNAFTDPVALWAVLDQITPIYCLYVDVPRPDYHPENLLVETLTETSGNEFFILVDPVNLPALDFNALNVDTTNSANLASLQVISDSGVEVDTDETNLPPYARPEASIIDAPAREVVLSANAGDVDGSVVSYAWTWEGGSSNGDPIVATLPYGDVEFSVTVTDDAGATATSTSSFEHIPLRTVDTDGDGLNDFVEYTLRNHGFNWDDHQSDLAAAVEAAGLVSRSDLPSEGYYDLEGMRALQAPAPVISRDAATGKARLTLGIQQSSDLDSFSPLPATAPEVSITPEGEIQFEFDTPEGSGFYRIEVN